MAVQRTHRSFFASRTVVVAFLQGIAALFLAGGQQAWAGPVPTDGGIFSNALTSEGSPDDLVPEFETWSNRLSTGEGKRFDRLAEVLRKRADSRLVVLVANPSGIEARHFIDSRMVVLERELKSRGVSYDIVRLAHGAGTEPEIALRLVPRTLPPTPVEILSGDANGEAKSPGVQGGPVPLLPASPPLVTAAAPAERTPPVPPPKPESAAGGAPSGKVESDDVWLAAAGRTMRGVLKEWGDHAGWTIVWQSDRDYPLDASASFTGDFTTAATQLFDGFASAVPTPLGRFYKGNRVLVVEAGEGR